MDDNRRDASKCRRLPIGPAIVARALHVVGAVPWIGGVGFVTSVLLPSVRRMKSPEERVAFFEAVEGRFAWQTRGTTLLVGATGFHLTAAWDLWHRWSLERVKRDAEDTFRRIERMHWVLLAISLLTVAGAHGWVF